MFEKVSLETKKMGTVESMEDFKQTVVSNEKARYLSMKMKDKNFTHYAFFMTKEKEVHAIRFPDDNDINSAQSLALEYIINSNAVAYILSYNAKGASLNTIEIEKLMKEGKFNNFSGLPKTKDLLVNEYHDENMNDDIMMFEIKEKLGNNIVEEQRKFDGTIGSTSEGKNMFEPRIRAHAKVLYKLRDLVNGKREDSR